MFAILTATYMEGDYSWYGAYDTDHAFAIRSASDYTAAQEYFFPEDDDMLGWDLDWSYSINFVVAPTSIIEVKQP